MTDLPRGWKNREVGNLSKQGSQWTTETFTTVIQSPGNDVIVTSPSWPWSNDKHDYEGEGIQ